jgi:hypothetical protein
VMNYQQVDVIPGPVALYSRNAVTKQTIVQDKQSKHGR